MVAGLPKARPAAEETPPHLRKGLQHESIIIFGPIRLLHVHKCRQYGQKSGMGVQDGDTGGVGKVSRI